VCARPVRYAGRSDSIVVDPLSDKNPLLKQIRRAVSRGTLTEDGYAVAEGAHLLDEAIAAKCDIKAVLVGTAQGFDRVSPQYPNTCLITEKTLRSLASTETPQPLIALVKPPAWTEDQLTGGSALVVVLDGIQDPGNAGAILRAAEAFGATGAVFLKGTVNPYNPKCIRASAGSIFRLPVVSRPAWGGPFEQLPCYAAMPRATALVSEIDFRKACAIVIGSEGKGVSEVLAARATGFRIPTSHVESLNAAVAAGVILYEARRQRDGCFSAPDSSKRSPA
jgi:TrmH family RNA methyltransferase